MLTIEWNELHHLLYRSFIRMFRMLAKAISFFYDHSSISFNGCRKAPSSINNAQLGISFIVTTFIYSICPYRFIDTVRSVDVVKDSQFCSCFFFPFTWESIEHKKKNENEEENYCMYYDYAFLSLVWWWCLCYFAPFSHVLF